ncbi:hypothetical protein BOTBODRAFT_610540 [Botryobasidium botryosum FD-172 SS1]|uniref:Uncharacterized protein n=1 Tax=Botryobasidium botryosum (strain FD-172 SS1) TaxID=930990 RepID=A0A067M677_BOTB1|nr:hypothetical protein BOTBODRAFT_610540 [Botryobasidium botryosum FD-172 SS1]
MKNRMQFGELGGTDVLLTVLGRCACAFLWTFRTVAVDLVTLSPSLPYVRYQACRPNMSCTMIAGLGGPKRNRAKTDLYRSGYERRPASPPINTLSSMRNRCFLGCGSNDRCLRCQVNIYQRTDRVDGKRTYTTQRFATSFAIQSHRRLQRHTCSISFPKTVPIPGIVATKKTVIKKACVQ